jgi:hypothetical protein
MLNDETEKKINFLKNQTPYLGLISNKPNVETYN